MSNEIFMPPGEEWDSFALALVGRTVSKFFDQMKDEEDVCEYLEPSAIKWNDVDENPDGRDWVEDFNDKISRVWQQHCHNNARVQLPSITTAVVEEKKEEDVLILESLYVKGGSEVPAMGLKEALEKTWDSDMLVQAIQSPTATRKTKKDLSDCLMTYFFFDFDMPEHAPLTEEFLTDELGKIEGHKDLSNYYAAYTTKHGFRVIYDPGMALDVPYWKQGYDYLCGLMDEAGITSRDENTSDFTRMMRLPKVVRDGVRLDELPLFALDIPEKEIKIPDFAVDSPKEVPEVISNFVMEENADGQPIRVPRTKKEVLDNIYAVTDGWPKRLGSSVFYLNGDEIVEISNASGLMSYLQGFCKVGFTDKGVGMITKSEIFEAFKQLGERFDGVSNCPHIPPRKDIYYTHTDIKTKAGTEFLDKLMDFFCPATMEDKILLKSSFCSPILNVAGGGRPVFVLESSSGQGAGKTTFAEMVALLYDCDPIMLNPSSIGKDEEIMKTILSPTGRKSRVIVLDNMVGTVKSPTIASFITSKLISGRKPYGRGMETRQNDLTWFITSNDADFDKDMISRSFFVQLKEHQPDPEWLSTVTSFIKDNRTQILEEICSLVQRDPSFKKKPSTRYSQWESMILQNCASLEDYSRVLTLNKSRKLCVDADKIFCEELENLIKSRFLRDGLSTKGTYWMTKQVLFNIAKEGDTSLRKNNWFFGKIKSGIKTGGFNSLGRSEYSDDRGWRDGPRGYSWNFQEDVNLKTRVLEEELGRLVVQQP